MRKLIVSEFVTLDGVMQAPGGKDEDRDGGFEHGGWTLPYWHDDIGAALRRDDAGRRRVPARPPDLRDPRQAFEPMPAGDPFGDMMNAPKKYVVSRTLEKPIWRNTTIIRDNVVDAVRALKAQPGRNILTDGSSQLVHALLAARPGRRAAPAPLSADRSAAASDCSPTACTRVHAEVGDAISERRRRPALHAQR